MYRASADDRGTLQSLAQELDEAQETGKLSFKILRLSVMIDFLEGGITFKLGNRAETRNMPQPLYYLVLEHFRLRLGDGIIHSLITLPPNPRSEPLHLQAVFFDQVIVDYNQFSALSRSTSVADSLVAVRIPGSQHPWVGELLDIFVVDQRATGLHHFGHVRWLVPSTVNLQGTIWQHL